MVSDDFLRGDGSLESEYPTIAASAPYINRKAGDFLFVDATLAMKQSKCILGNTARDVMWQFLWRHRERFHVTIVWAVNELD